MKIIYYQSPSGKVPVKEALDELERERPDEHTAVFRKMGIVRGLNFTEAWQEEHIKHVRGKILCLKVHNHQSRLLGFMWRGRWIAAVHTIKKQDKLSERAIERAEQRMESWHERLGE